MVEKVLMPQLGESVTEGTISQWLVSVGDEVKKYDPICEVMTDKVNAEVPSMFTGTITEIVAKEGETISVGALMCYLSPEGVVASIDDKVESQDIVEKDEFKNNNTSKSIGKQRLSPAVLKLVQEHGLNIEAIQGTGAGGRTTRKDVLMFIENQQNASMPVVEESPNEPTSFKKNQEVAKNTGKHVISEAIEGDQTLPVTAIRKTIANRMVQSKHEAPHAWMTIECDVTNLVNYRNELKDEFKRKEGINLTYFPFFIQSVVEALKEFPILNSQWVEDEIILKKAINMSIAVATDEALFVPVIKDADQKNVLGLAKSVNELVSKTRDGKLAQEDISGGTFTINNTGSFGSVLSAPIINHPQAAILSIEAIIKRPVIVNQMIAVRDMVNIYLSLDHRVLDGLVCGQFLQAVRKNIENYGSKTSIY